MLLGIQIHEIVGIGLFLLYAVSVASLVLVLLLENRNPLKTIPWVIVLIFLPGVGLIFYFFFGQDNRRQRIISAKTYKRIIRPLGANRIMHDTDACSVQLQFQPLANLLKRNGRCVMLYGSEIEYFTNGADKFKAFLDDIASARHHIHVQYYIFNDDEIGETVRRALIAKAREGVIVRVLYDDVGCWNVKKQFFNEMRDAGIEVFAFLRVVFPVFSGKVNYRNHRKIVVIDGKTGYIGGMNIADRYVTGSSLGFWRDTHFRISGKGVYGLQSAFLIDWYAASRRFIKGKVYYPKLPVYEDNIMQIAVSGPTDRWRTLLQAVSFCIANAKKYIYIQTPYFLPTEGLNQMLQMVAMGGVDVRLMLPKQCDTRLVNMATHSFIDDMLKAGVKVYFYTAGFLHSKLFLTDDELACIGSANFDFRSFEHNFEVNAFVYHAPFALRMKEMFMNDLEKCEHVVRTEWRKRPLLTRLSESFMRLFSPLL
ncbi:MAG: cardiolipin synthase [Tannerella sp.]|jgi:cardiolipin synthase|nr:cardiolipin synthase [Tannerella sp.]